MPTINKNAFKGYGYQWTVAILFCYFLEFYKETFKSLVAESGNNEHNFDDFSMTTIDGIIHVQTKNYVNEFDEMPIVNNGAVSYCGSSSKLSKTGINIFVCRSSIPSSAQINNDFYGIPSIFYPHDNLHVVFLNENFIQKYVLENSIDEDRLLQLNLFFTNKLLNSLIIDSCDLPEFKFFSKKLQNETFKIRQMPVVKKGVNFIIAPPGYGKSHFVNELGISDSHVYRFWVCNEDEDGAKRLQFDNFIAQMSAQLFQDKRKRTQNEIIEKMSETNCVYAIDGLDHVFNYARNQFLNFLNFISNASLKSNICLLVLTREIPGHTFDDYNKIVLKKWSRKETFSFLQNFSISNHNVYDQIYSISAGYPLVTYLLAQDYLKNGFISNTNVIKDVNDYYREILSIEDHDNTIFSLGLISILHPFIHKQDFVYFKQELALQNLISAARKYPYLINMERSRFYFYHDSLYSYVRDEFFKSDSNKKSLDDIYDKIYASLLNGETQFMGRFSLSYFNEECNKTIVKKYCNLNFFQKIAINTFDFESLQEIYKKIIVSLKLKDARYLSIYETYNLLTILLILNRNFYSDNVNLSVQLFNYFKNNNIMWENLIFSSGRLYKNLCDLSMYKLTNKSDELYNPEPMQSLFEDAKNESSFFNVLTSDFSIKLLPYLENAKYIDSNLFCEFIVSNYIHGNDGGNSKNFVNAYLARPRQYLKCEAVKAFSFVNHSTDMFPIFYGCNKAVIRLQQLGIIDGVGNYKTFSSLLTDIKNYNSYQVSDYVNGYVRYATKYNKQIELNQISEYLMMMDGYKDATLKYVPEAMAFFVKKDLIPISKCIKWMEKFYMLKDSGNNYFATEFANSLGPSYYNDLKEAGFFSNDAISVMMPYLSVDLLNCFESQSILEIISEIEMANINQDYISDEKFGNILKCKYKNKVRQYLKIDNYSIKKSFVPPVKHARKPTKELLNDGYYKFEYKDFYNKLGFSIFEVAAMKDGHGYKLPSAEMFYGFDKETVKKNISKIVHIVLFEADGVFGEYNQYNAPLLYSIPELFDNFGGRVNFKKMCDVFTKFLDIVFRI